MIFRKGKKVGLRPILEEDITLFHSWINDPEVSQYMSVFGPCSLEIEIEWFKRVSKNCNGKISNDYTFALIDLKNNKLIGSMGIHNIDFINRTGTTGAMIGDKNYWSKGYGSEAKKLLLEFAFNELNLRKIYSEVIGYNKRSLAYSEKCGYKVEARLPKHYYKKGKYWDKIILAIYKN